jgi:hypothetical protein
MIFSSTQLNSSVRITHIPSGESVVVMKERSQHKNKELGLNIIRARLQAEELGLEKPMVDNDTVNTRCPICEQGILIELVNYREEIILGELFSVPSVYCTCSYCEVEQVDPEQSRTNKEVLQIIYQLASKIRERK